MSAALLPWPRQVRRGPPLRIERGPNDIRGDCCERLARAVRRLPPLALSVIFEVDREGASAPLPDTDESYCLGLIGTAGALTGARVRAGTEWGALAALATLAQLGAADSVDVTRVRDAPRYAWRGLMIDTVRHFISLPTLERTLDVMSFYKLNVLHLHLTDDQGFRFRSVCHPELASDDAFDRAALSELVARASDRGVRVVPELGVPGHATSWLAAHPEWAADGGRHAAPSARFGVHEGRLDATRPDVRRAIAALFEELAAIFPDPFIHFGGDEVELPDAERRALYEHLGTVAARLGKRLAGWDECLHEALPAGTLVQAWRSVEARDAALGAGYDCVLSAPYYLDLCYPASVHYAVGPAADAEAAHAALTSEPRLAHVRDGIEWMRAFADVPRLPQRPPGRLLGGEACLWSELVNDELLDMRLWSRMPAIAERFWSGADADPDDVYARQAETRRALVDRGILAADEVAADFAGLEPLIEMLEPVKWYRRLLGEGGYRQRVSGLGTSAERRPYDATTPLDRLVDRLPPESAASRRAEADLAGGATMTKWLAGWRRQREALAAHPGLHDELGAASAALAAVADVVEGVPCADPAALAGPHGEYLLPIAYAL